MNEILWNAVSKTLATFASLESEDRREVHCQLELDC